MNRIESKVRSARRRMVLGRFGQALSITLFAALIVATLAIALPALRAIDIDFTTWVYSWVGGCVVGAVIAAAVYAAKHRRQAASTATVGAA